jgi:hypothetical protein
MATCRADGHEVTCPGGCGVLVDHETGEAYIMCASTPKISVDRGDGKMDEMTLEDFTANYTPKNKIGPETKVSFTCIDLDSSVLAEVLQKISPNEITVSERIANQKLNITLRNTTLAEIMKSSGFA